MLWKSFMNPFRRATLGAFSVSVSLLDDVIGYIRNQEKHHHKMTFQEEFITLLKKHRIEYDERYLWD